jgi:hypothetical protein
MDISDMSQDDIDLLTISASVIESSRGRFQIVVIPPTKDAFALLIKLDTATGETWAIDSFDHQHGYLTDGWKSLDERPNDATTENSAS